MNYSLELENLFNREVRVYGFIQPTGKSFEIFGTLTKKGDYLIVEECLVWDNGICQITHKVMFQAKRIENIIDNVIYLY